MIELDKDVYPFTYKELDDTGTYDILDGKGYIVAVCLSKSNAELLVRLAKIGFEKAWYIKTGEQIGRSA